MRLRFEAKAVLYRDRIKRGVTRNVKINMPEAIPERISSMENRTKQYVCLGVAVLLIIAGTLATGLLPSTPLFQVLAGGVIVAGFAVVYACLGPFELFE